MKRIKYAILMLLCIPFTALAVTGSSGMDYNACKAFADIGTNIKTTYEYKYCYRALCSTSGKWNLANMVSSSGYRCTNGNPNPYTKVTSNGCSKFSGSCTANAGSYCTSVQFIDCTKKSDGTPYSTSSTNKSTNSSSPKPTASSSSSTNSTKSSKTKKSGGTGKVIIPVTTNETTTEGTRPTVPTEEAKSSNLNVNFITINGTDIKYRNGYDYYTIQLPYGVRDVDITVDVEDEKTVTFIEGAYDMPDENTQIKVTVTAEDESTKTILIDVSRYSGESKDCTIASISLNDYELSSFDKNNYNYNLRINRKTKSLYMDIIPSDPLHATVEVLGNNNLQNNSMVTINVKAESGDMCSYNITVKKSSGAWIPVVITLIVLAVLGAVGLFVYKYIKRSKDMYKYE